MKKPNSISLDVIDIKTPCPASWDAMDGNDRVRFCGECKLHVYDLSAMTREAAETFIAEREGRLCVRFYRRDDGKIVTRDCGRIRAAARRVRAFATAAATVVLASALLPVSRGFARTNASGMNPLRWGPLARVVSWFTPADPPVPLMGSVAPQPPVNLMGEVAPSTQPVMGDVAIPVSQQANPTTMPTHTMGIIAVPPTTRPSTQPATKPANASVMGKVSMPK